MSRRPTKRAFLIAGIGMLLIFAGVTAQAGWLFVLAAGVLGLVVGSFVVRHRLSSLVVTRSTPRRVRVGDLVRVGLTVQNSRSHAVPLFTLDDVFPAFPPGRAGVERIGPGQSVEVEFVHPAVKRGVFRDGEVLVACGAPFGIARSRRKIAVESDVMVVPRWVELATFPVVDPSASSTEVMREIARAGAGGEFLGVREFRPGDPLRSVHWRTTARAGTLVVREFEQEISSRVALVLAGTDHGEGPQSSFEMLVSACASVGIYALDTGHPVDLITVGQDAIVPLVDSSRHALLDKLATAEPADASLEPLVEAALERLVRRGTVVIFGTSDGNAGASLDAAFARVERAGMRGVMVVARSASWTGSPDEARGFSSASVPLRLLESDKDLGACLAG